MDFFLWSRAAVGQLVEQEYGITLPVRSMGKYLARWGFTLQRPIKRAYEQNPEAVQAWLQGEYPDIEQRARREGAEINWGDETALTNTDVRGRSYAPAGNFLMSRGIPTDRQREWVNGLAVWHLLLSQSWFRPESILVGRMSELR